MTTDNSLPYPADLRVPLSRDELGVLQDAFNKESASGYPGLQTRFNLAWGLTKSTQKEDILQGVQMFGVLYQQNPDRRRECLYYLALGHYRLGNFDEAARFNNMLLSKEPANLQAQSLNQLIEKDVSKEGLVGAAIVGGAAALAVAIGISIFKRKR